MSKAEAARAFGVAISSVKRYVNIARKGESLAPKKAPGKKRTLDQKTMKLLEEDLYRRPEATYGQRARLLFELLGLRVSEATLCRAFKRLGCTRKKVSGRVRTGRVLEGGLEDFGCRGSRYEPARVRGRDGCEHLALFALCLLPERTKGPRENPAQSREEHDAIGEHDGRRDGAVCSGRRYYYLSGLRGLRGAGPRADPAPRSSGKPRQPLLPQWT